MTASTGQPHIDTALDIKGKVPLLDPATGQVIGYGVVQGCSSASAQWFNSAGQPRMLRAHVQNSDPRTPAQLARRAIHAAAVAAYKADPAACRAQVEADALSRNITPFMAWCSLYHRAHST